MNYSWTIELTQSQLTIILLLYGLAVFVIFFVIDIWLHKRGKENFIRGVKSGLILAYRHNRGLEIVEIFKDAYGFDILKLDPDLCAEIIDDLRDFMEN